MIQTEEQIEQPGKNAKEHFCEAMREADEGEATVKCRIEAHEQCSECAMWLCGTEELQHAIICVRCGHFFCPEHFSAHKMSKDCEQRAAA